MTHVARLLHVHVSRLLLLLLPWHTGHVHVHAHAHAGAHAVYAHAGVHAVHAHSSVHVVHVPHRRASLLRHHAAVVSRRERHQGTRGLRPQSVVFVCLENCQSEIRSKDALVLTRRLRCFVFRLHDLSSFHIGENALRGKSVVVLGILVGSLLRWHRSQCVEHWVGLRLHFIVARHVYVRIVVSMMLRVVSMKTHSAANPDIHPVVVRTG